MKHVHAFWIVATPLMWGTGWGFWGQQGVGVASAILLGVLAMSYIMDIIG